MIIDGKQIAFDLKEKIKNNVGELNEKGVQVSLSVILVGDDAPSHVYVKNKEKACLDVGIKSNTYRLPENTSTSQLLELIDVLNNDNSTHGILVQVPLPKGIDQELVLSCVSPKKDVDCFHLENVGALYLNQNNFLPCTANGVIKLIQSTGEKIEGKHAVILGRSNIVGKPLIHLLLQENATVTVCHSKTANLKDITKTADILISAIGKKHLVTADMIKDGAVVIDVGINRCDGKLYGDVDFENVKDKASFITPVPGGVGPMTIACLLENTVKSASEFLCKKR